MIAIASDKKTLRQIGSAKTAEKAVAGVEAWAGKLDASVADKIREYWKDYQDRPMCSREKCYAFATTNVQSALIVWDINARGNYSKRPVSMDPDDEINYFGCEDHPDHYEDYED